MDILIWFVIFIISLFVLSKAADFFNNAAEAIGVSWGIPKFTIGILLVAVGTSLPELISSIISMRNGLTEVVFGNVTGSNITNIFFIMGVASIIYRKEIKLELLLIKIDLQFLMASSLFIIITCYDGIFTIYEGLFLLAAYFIYLVYLVGNITSRVELNAGEIEGKRGIIKYYILFPISIFLLFISGHWAIKSVIQLSANLNIGAAIIASSAIAIGTSLPELFVTITAFKKNKPEMAVGNILGSCIFNSLSVMGLSSLFGTITITPEVLHTCLLFMLLATVLFFIIARDRNLNKWEGYLLILFYILFVGKLFAVF